ncbi:mitochondrial tRNA-specific 2-thiouridylase 1-like [Mya arenaria]|uniref:mitochondrial tRNA-specific 2-thiouridylase 1-like n=1 Tax=Mya arenaria TaxID=6604 RepID=UPI0022E74F2C|nr:mitochondrial tRNA-specific 2-thiouridylase 1-like [Mya arenaria]
MKITKVLFRTKKIVCGISGGVDSAVSALLLKLKGYDVHGLFMKNWDSANEHGVCIADEDREYAQFVCSHLGIPFHEVNFVKKYWNEVFSAFLQDLQQGKTPNPDVLCNKYIKFDAFFKYATESLGADAIATGHYVRSSAGYDLDNIDPKKGVNLLKARDPLKCQTLFLSQISQNALQRALFPIGDMIKSDVKQIARDYGMEKVANKRESVGICFIGKRNFKDFTDEYMEPRLGNFINLETGENMGPHKGFYAYTMGQKSQIGGLGVGMFIAHKDTDTNDIYVVPGTDHPALFVQTIFTEECHWINKPPRQLLTDQMYNCEFKYQHVSLSGRKLNCTLTLSGGNSVIVSVDQPIRAIVPGQFAVFYDGDVCLGSGKIRKTGPSMYTMGERSRLPQYLDIAVGASGS